MYEWLFVMMLAAWPMAIMGEVSAAPVIQAPRADATPVVRMNVRPASPARPALRYRLLPGFMDQTPGNAATLYLQALALQHHPGVNQTSATLFNRIDVLLSEPQFDAAKAQDAQATLASLNASYLKYVDMAARRDRCEWGLTLRDEGYYAQLPHLNGMRSIASAVALDVRVAIASGNYARAIQRLQTGYALARHLNEEAVFVQNIVGAGIAHLMCQQVAELIKAPNSPNLYWALAALPHPFAPIRDAMQNERHILEFTVPELRNIRAGDITAEQFRRLLDQLTSLRILTRTGTFHAPQHTGQRFAASLRMVSVYPEAKQYLIERGTPAQAVNQMPVHQVLASYLLGTYEEEWDDVCKWSSIPYWQAQAGIRRTEQQVYRNRTSSSQSPLTALIPAWRTAYLRIAILDRQIALLQCVEAIRAYAATHQGALPARLEDIVDTPAPIDPLTGKLFRYEVQGSTAILDASMPAGEDKRMGWRYEITISQ